MINDSVVKFAKIAGAKVRFDKGYASNLGPYWTNLAFTAKMEIDEVQQILMENFWTVRRYSDYNDCIIISLSEHFPDIKDNPGFYYYRFDQVKVYLSST